MPRIMTPDDIANFRNRLCEIGAELFAEQGFGGFNMRELARRLGVSAMTPYRYFKDKNEILSEVRTIAFARFADWLAAALAVPGTDDGALARAYAHYAIQQHKQYRLMFDLAFLRLETLPAQAAHERRIRALMAAQMMEDGQASAEESDAMGLVLWSALHGATALYLAAKLSQQELDRALVEVVRLYMGCGNRQRASSVFDAMNSTGPFLLRDTISQQRAVA